MNAPKYAQNTITEYSIQPTKLYGDFRGRARYDLMSVIFICLGKPSRKKGLADDERQQLLDLLAMISSPEISVKDKLTSLERDYHIATTREVKEGISSMCNWSEGIIERAVDENTEKHILSLMELSNVSFEEACRLLNVDPEYYAELMFDIDKRP